MSNSVFLPHFTIGADAYKDVPKICQEYGRRAVVIGGKTALAKATDMLKVGVANSAIELIDFVWYGGDSSFENVEMLKNNQSVQNAEMIFSVGGGRVHDTCKTLAEQLNKPIFTFPTIASNCACVTAVNVIYDANAVFKELYFMEKSPVHTFINSQIIAEAPVVYLWAGIGDALSKEVECTFSARGDELNYADALGVQVSKMCNEPLLKYGEKAMQSCQDNVTSFAFEQVILDILVTTGLVSVLVINDYNSNLAHSIYYGTTAVSRLEENHLHGEVVSYGVLVLLTLDKQFELRDRVYKFMKNIKLPTQLADIELEIDSIDFNKMLDKAMTTADLQHSPYTITREMIYHAIVELEEYNNLTH